MEDDEFPAKLVVACTGGIKGNMSKHDFTAAVKDAAACAIRQHCFKNVINNIDIVMDASSDDAALNMKGALFVVDSIFHKAGEAENPGQCLLSTRLAHALAPYVAGWLCKAIIRQSGPDGWGRFKMILSRWNNMKWVSEQDTCKLLEVFEAMETNRTAAHSLLERFKMHRQRDSNHQLANDASHTAVSSTGKPNHQIGGAMDSIAEPNAKRSRCSVGTGRAEQGIESTQKAREIRIQQSMRSLPKSIVAHPGANKATMGQTHAAVGSGGDPKPDTWRVYGDCRCLFRAICRACQDPLNKIARDVKGRPVEEKPRNEELTRADDLRAQVCLQMRKNKDWLAKQIAGEMDVEEYLSRMEDWRTWGDAICLSFIADLIQRPIQVYALNIAKNSVFESGLHLPKDESKHGEHVVVLWYNGKSHYDLVSTLWLRERERDLYSAAKL